MKAEFSQYKTADKAELEQQLAKAIEQAHSLGADPETLPKVKELRAKLAGDAVDITALESEVYDHLFGFFRRYYSEGDFLSKRVYKPGVYAIPYEGEEVKLHWANADQYYIKTSEYLRDYAFRLRPEDEANPMRVHFRLVDVAEGEHGNVKPSEGKDRVFILAAADFICEEEGEQGRELVIRFEYRPATLMDWPEDVRDEKKKPPTQKDMTTLAEKLISSVEGDNLSKWITELAKSHEKADGERAEYSRLHAHLHRYIGRNTFDYFIHKDLGSFLRRELDFYIKNEVMHLDDVENETAPRVEQYLSKIKIIRRIAGKVIAFLSQLEDFQKKLWLKAKFVVETNYCITLDQIPEEFYPDIAENVAQRDEWVHLLAIDGIEGDLVSPKYSTPLTVSFLRAHKSLMVDTRHFDSTFKAKLVATISDVEATLSGTLIHSDSFHATRLALPRYKRSLTTAYNDPPYNTDASAILYKNGYRNSSWCSLISAITESCYDLLTDDGILCTTIDDQQVTELTTVLKSIFGEENLLGTVSVRSNPSGRITLRGVAQCHEYAIFCSKTRNGSLSKLPRSDEQAARFDQQDDNGAFEWRNFRRDGSSSTRTDRPKQFFPIFVTEDSLRIPDVRWDEATRQYEILENPRDGESILWPIDSSQDDRCWRWGIETAIEKLHELVVKRNPQGLLQVYNKYRPNSDGVLPLTIWTDTKYSSTEYGTAVVKNIFGLRSPFDFPKSLFATKDCLHVASIGPTGTVLDCFGGSGTTAHATIDLNRGDGGSRKYLLLEMGAHFDTVLVPRIKKVVYSKDWRDGKPVSLDFGISHAFKTIRLESYEDALNNLVPPRRSSTQQLLIDAADAQGADRLREQYILRYMLNVETEGSPSLLNVQAFTDPTSYQLKVKRPGSDESREVNVDLLETFNWLIGLTVQHIAAPQCFTAKFERDCEKRLGLKGRLKQDDAGPHWFRTVTGMTPDGRKTLIIWRKRPGGEAPEGVEQDNLVLDDWFTRQGYSSKDSEFDLIYVNGTNNLENLRAPDDTWKVRLIEDDFHRLMFAAEGL